MMALDLGFFSKRSMRLIRQTEMSECGLACLAMIGSHWSVDLNLAYLRRRFSISQRGATINTLMVAADKLGFAARPLKVPLEDMAHLELPAILHWDLNHYVVLESIRNGLATIYDPAGAIRKLPMNEMSRHFTGIALELTPVSRFKMERPEPKLAMRQLWQGVSGLKRTLFQIAVLSVVVQAFILLAPYYLQIAIDKVIPSADVPFFVILSAGFAGLALIYAAASFLRSFVFLSAGTKLSFSMSSNVARHLFRLPIKWFERRHVGDVLSRFQSLRPIEELLIQGSVVTALDGALAIVILAIMFVYSPLLASVSLGAFLLNLLIRMILFRLEKQATEAAIATRAKEQSILIETIDGIVPLRLFAQEPSRFSLWQNRLSDSLNAGVSEERIKIWQETVTALIMQVETILIIVFAVGFVLAEELTVGMLFAFISYKTLFSQNTAKLVEKIIEYRMLDLHLERISDIALADQDVSHDHPGEGSQILRGQVKLLKVRFRYSDADPLVVDNVDLTIEAGEHIAIKGPSGGGKSTLAKLVLGLVEPTEGRIVIDGLPLKEFGYRVYHQQIAAVLQDDVLFSGSIADNITLFERGADVGLIEEAASDASILQDIVRMPMKFETLVTERGSNLSGGQRQRILLARALYRRPRLIVMDEGTSSLDLDHEARINDSIKRLKITRIVIAHREATIRQAEKIYSMSNGVLSLELT